MTGEPYTLQVSLNAIDARGRNLYSNAAAVLAELVANGWDADANNVWIDYHNDAGWISIRDDGSGMTAEQLNNRFLTVGYRKRECEGPKSKKFGRVYMGRKGIGKLSIFSLADVAEVYSRVDGGDINGFTINVEDLESAMTGTGETTYHPVLTNYNPDDHGGKEFPKHGTIIKLSALRTKRAGVTTNALRLRVARRFPVLGGTDSDSFNVTINDRIVTFEDREDLRRVEYVWTLGDFKLPENSTSAEVFKVPDTSTEFGDVSGWIGTVNNPSSLSIDGD